MSSRMLDPRRRYPNRPLVDDASQAVLDEAVYQLIILRSPMRYGDAGATLHALASLHDNINAALPGAVDDARDQGYTPAQIAKLIGPPARPPLDH